MHARSSPENMAIRNFLVLVTICLTQNCECFVAEPDIVTMEQDVANLKQTVAILQQTVNTLQAQLNSTSDLAAQAAAGTQGPAVAFTAHLTKTITHVALHQHIAFDNVITNVGGAYATSNGHFKAPVFGLYAFFVTATNRPGYSTSLTLMKNGQGVGVTLAHGSSSTPGQWETSTMAAVLTLVAGEEVWAQNEQAFSPVEELDGYNYSSFTGYLVHKM